MGSLMADVPQIGAWHPHNADGFDELDKTASAAYVRLLGPFMQTYPALTVLDYWELTVNEHAAMTDWLYEAGVITARASETTP